MRVVYQTQIVNSQTYITGWYACAPDNPDAVELDSQLEGVTQWLDESGNPVWVLNGDGTVSNSPIIVSAPLVQQAASQDILNSLLINVVYYLANGEKVPPDLLDTWNIAYASLTK